MIEAASLVDQYCHGVIRTELGLGTFEAQLGRASGPSAPGTTFFDTQTGFAVRRWYPPLLGLDPHCTPARYLARRRELGTLEVAGRLPRSTGISTDLVDTPGPGDMTRPDELAVAGRATAHEIVRLEPLAERVADVSAAQVFREALARVLGGWVADGAWLSGDARRVAGMIAAGNARRLYGLSGDGPSGR